MWAQVKKFSAFEEESPETTYTSEFLAALLSVPALTRNVALVGHLHAGKTALSNMLIEQVCGSSYRCNSFCDSHFVFFPLQTRVNPFPKHKEMKYTDARVDEQARKISIKSTPFSVVLPNTEEKSYVFNFIDTPGHVNFSDEVTAALRAVDGIVLVVDAVEGVMMNTDRCIKHAIQDGLPLVLVINKVDRLILELKLPPNDAYMKLAHTIQVCITLLVSILLSSLPTDSTTLQEVNKLIKKYSLGSEEVIMLSPAAGNVIFASATANWSFTLHSFANQYVSRSVIPSISRKMRDEYFSIKDRIKDLKLEYAQVENEILVTKKKVGSGEGDKEELESLLREQQYISTDLEKLQQKLNDLSVPSVDPVQLAQRLWGDLWFDNATNKFRKTEPYFGAPRSFVQFVLEPLYKLHSAVVSLDSKALGQVLNTLSISLTATQLKMDVKPLLQLVMAEFLGKADGFVDSLVQFILDPIESARKRIESIYLGDIDSPEVQDMMNGNSEGLLMMNVVKEYPSPDGSTFFAFARIWSGTIRPGMRVKVLGEGYSAEDTEDLAIAEVKSVAIGQGRYRLELTHAQPGALVLLEGISDVIAKTATVTGATDDCADVAIFKPLVFNTTACVNISVEPLNPSELPKMLAGLRAVTKSYPLARTKAEESGEHVLIGTGELAMDSMLYDLREMFSKIEVNVSDPMVSFNETCLEQSSLHSFAKTPNKKNTLKLMAEPLDKELGAAIERGDIDILNWSQKTVRTVLEDLHGWDPLEARNLWAFGPSPATGPNVFVDDTLPDEVDKKLLYSVKESVVHGFRWGSKEGPLCDEPIRNVKFKLINADLAAEPIARGAGQIIPTARRLVYTSFLLASPRLMEPIYQTEVMGPADILPVVRNLLQGRRGHVIEQRPNPGTPFTIFRCQLPVIDSFGFETDLRIHTQGQAFCLSVFSHWDIVPGDPLDKSIVLRPLEKAPQHALAREFMIKTRRRKGLAEDVSVTRYFDEEMLMYLLEQEQEALRAQEFS